ncbi:MAG: (2Fe-2S)-binding protein [Rhodothermales bacterium]
MAIRIDRCVCHGFTFAEIKREADAAGLTRLDELRARGLCGNGCGLCHPYLRRMLETGETAFRTLLPPEEPRS